MTLFKSKFDGFCHSFMTVILTCTYFYQTIHLSTISYFFAQLVFNHILYLSNLNLFVIVTFPPNLVFLLKQLFEDYLFEL